MNKLLDKQIHELLTRRDGRGLAECEGTLRVGAASARRVSDGESPATTVICAIAGRDFDAVEDLVADIAHEYGLEASIRRRGGSCSVRFSWPQPGERGPSATSDTPLLARLLRR